MGDSKRAKKDSKKDTKKGSERDPGKRSGKGSTQGVKASAKASTKASAKGSTKRSAASATAAPIADGDRLATLLDAVWEHRDELQRLAVELPTLLAATGVHLQEAGFGARRASAGLSGDVRELAGHAADMLAASKDQLRAVLAALESTGAVLKNIPFIGGELGSTVVGGLGAIADVADHLEIAGDKVRTLGERLAVVGADLDVMGGSLLDSARAMGDFAGVPLPAPAPGPRRAAASPRPKKATRSASSSPAKAAAKGSRPSRSAPTKG